MYLTLSASHFCRAQCRGEHAVADGRNQSGRRSKIIRRGICGGDIGSTAVYVNLIIVRPCLTGDRSHEEEPGSVATAHGSACNDSERYNAFGRARAVLIDLSALCGKLAE